MADIQKWKIKGQWFDVCRCAVPCPCSWAQPPDDDFCQGILLWHIQEGHYGSVKLDDLNMVMIGTASAHLPRRLTRASRRLPHERARRRDG